MASESTRREKSARLLLLHYPWLLLFAHRRSGPIDVDCTSSLSLSLVAPSLHTNSPGSIPPRPALSILLPSLLPLLVVVFVVEVLLLRSS